MPTDNNSWDEIIGNEELKEHFQNITRLIHQGRMDQKPGSIPMNVCSTLIIGESRSGKSMIAQFFIKCMLCKDFNLKTLSPCNSCKYCRDPSERNGWNYGIWSDKCVASTYWNDSSGVTEKVLSELKSRTRWEEKNKVIFFDEFQEMSRQFADHLLVSMQEDDNSMYLFSTTSEAGLGPAFLNRVRIVSTQAPSDDDYIRWLAKGCRERNIPVADADNTLRELAMRTRNLPGLGRLALDRACISPCLDLSVIPKIVNE